MKTIVCLLLSYLSVCGLFAQTNYYSQDKTFYKEGYTYQCDVTEGTGAVSLYNKDKRFIYVEKININTGEKIINTNKKIPLIEEDTWTKPKCLSIVNNAFTTEEKQRIKGRRFCITMYIDTSTGKIADVEFLFVTFNPYATIPVSVYRKIETEIKKNIWFTITPEGKKQNYIMLWWRQGPK